MMQKRTLYSLLLTSFILVFAFTAASAQVVTVASKSVARCQAQSIDVSLTNPDAISAFEIIVEVTSATGGAYFDAVDFVWDPGLTVLTNRVVDITAHYDGTPDTMRIAGMLIDPGDACLDPSTDLVVGQVEFTTNDVCDGTIELAGAEFVYPNVSATITTQFVDCVTTLIVPATVTAGTVTVLNQDPTIDGIADATLHWGDVYTGTATGDDLDLGNGCEGITFSKGSPAPADLDVDGNGYISWVTTGADVGTNEVTVVVTDECGATAETNFFICVENTPPEITCPTDTVLIIWGDTATGTVTGSSDPDNGPNTLLYSVDGFNGQGTPSIDPATGEWTWETEEMNGYQGLFELCLVVSDGGNIDPPCAPENADTCCVYINVIPTINVTIEKTHGTIQGQYEEVSINLDGQIDPAMEMGGFDFLIHYDNSALTLQDVEPGQFIDDCGWEYFTYRYGPAGNCGPNACPSGMVRIVAMAETNNGANHPACFTTDSVDDELAVMNFMVTNDRTFECQYVPIRWEWYDCGDNTISSKMGDTLFLSDEVFDYYFDGTTPGWINIEEHADFPTFFGANASCDTEDKYFPLRLVDFYNGGIDIVCADSIDARGDINLNGMAYEIGDAVLYSNYFVYGLSVLTPYLDAKTAASDVNADGIPLSVGDLVYLIRVIVGDADEYAKNVSPTAVEMVNNDGRLSIVNNVPMGAALVVANGQVTPELLATDMDMKYAYDDVNNQTRILVYSISATSFTGEFLEVQGELATVEMATYQGHPVKLDMVPSEFRLAQNYPNPFNPTTTIAFDVPVATSYTLTIFNINGQEVKTFAGTAEAGVKTVEWDASSIGSGVYFYRLEAGDFSATKKMVLVK